MPDYNESEKAQLARQFLPDSDENLLRFANNIVRAYGEMGLLSRRDVDAAADMKDIDAVNTIIAKVPEMTEEQRLEFCERFVGMEDENFNNATPAILAGAYRALSARAADDDAARARKEQLAARIDEMSADFANSGGMVVDTGNYPLVDTNNIADVYSGMVDMLNARKADLDAEQDATKIAEFNKNIEYADGIVQDYDGAWGISDIKPEYAPRLERRWDDLNDAVNRAELTDKTKATLSNYKFLDAENKVMPQFVDGKGNEYQDFQPGRKIIKDGRLASVVDFTRHDIMKRHVGQVEEEIDEAALENELNDQVLFKLYEMDMADKIVQGAITNPEQFSDPKLRDEFIANLAERGGEMSDAGYHAAVDAQTNATAGWAARIKAKLGGAAQKASGFFGKVFRPLQRLDRMKNVRMQAKPQNKLEKRIEFFVRMIKGFGSAFVASALITTIATAAAAVAGVSIAASLAIVGSMLAIGMGALQVHRWRKAQRAAGKPDDWRAFTQDKRLLTSLGASAIAVGAMVFGAAGFAGMASALGYGALTMGGLSNSVQTFNDARNSGLSMAESIAWAIANAGAVIAGGFAGRAVANNVIDAINRSNPENEVFQDKHETTRTIDNRHEETYQKYSDNALAKAEEIAKQWYADNPQELQARVDAINAYNAEHGTNIDPYRAIMINADAGGQTFDNMPIIHADGSVTHTGGHHTLFGQGYMDAHHISPETVNAAKNLFNGPITEQGMNAISQLDSMVNFDNTVGVTPGTEHLTIDPKYGLKSTLPDGFNSYADGKSAFETGTRIVGDVQTVTDTNYTRTMGDGMGMFGVYNPKEDKVLRDRVGTFPDRLRKMKKKPDPIPNPIPDPTPDPIPDPTPHYVPVPIDKPGPIVPIEDEITDVDWEPVIKQLPAGQDVRGFLPIGRPPLPDIDKIIDNKPKYPDLPRHEIRALPMGRSYAVTRAQAKSWDDLHINLQRVLDKLANPGLSKSQAADLQRKRKDILHDIEELYNKIGRPNAEDFEHARAEAYRRYELQNAINELAKHEIIKPKGGYAGARMPEWEKRRQELIDTIERLGGVDSLDESHLYYGEPVRGVQAQKKAERKQLEMRSDDAPKENTHLTQPHGEFVPAAEKDAVKMLPQSAIQMATDAATQRAGTVQGNREYFLPDALQKLAENASVLSTPLMNMRGAPVRLVDFTGNGNPIMQSDGRPMVVVDIDGLRVPFYLETGTERGANKHAGYWRPLYGIGYDGTLYTGLSGRTDLFVNLKSLDVIANTLDEKIGDVRNWRDIEQTNQWNQMGNEGFVGGCDVVSDMDAGAVCDDLQNNSYKGKKPYGMSMMNGHNKSVMTDSSAMSDALGTLDTSEFLEKRGRVFKALSKVLENSRRKLNQRQNNHKK